MSVRGRLSDHAWAALLARATSYNRRLAGRKGFAPAFFGASDWSDLDAIAAWQSARSLKPDGFAGPATLAAAKPAAVKKKKKADPAGAAPPPETRTSDEGGLARIGIWAERKALTSKDWRKKVLDIGLTDIVLVLNDNSDAHLSQGKKSFYTFQPLDVIKDCIAAYTDAGVRVSLMQWVVPTGSFLKDAGAALLELCDSGLVHSVHLDLEEPLTRYKGGLSAKDAAGRLAHELIGIKAQLAATGISYHNAAKLRPFINISDFVVPQGYSTNKKGKTWKSPAPGNGQELAFSKWQGYAKPIVMGLACYGQNKIPGYKNAAASLGKSLDTAVDLGVTEVVYWSLKAALLSKPVAAFLTARCEALKP